MQVVTIAQVAKEAGVSVATVSRVINQKGAVTSETAQRVLEAIDQLGYQPNVWGRNLRRGDSQVALLLVPNVTNPYYAPIIAGAEDALGREGFSMMLCLTNNAEAERQSFFLEFMRDGRADGAILIGAADHDPGVVRVAEEYRLVQCCEYCDSPAVSRVSIDNFEAARQAVARLLELGHTRVAFMGANNRFISTRCRRDGYRAALQAWGLPLREEYEVWASADYSFSSGVEATKRLLDLPDRPTALFCISDVLALGALQAARERGLRVPEDLSVVGFDDVEYAVMFQPHLTTIRQPGYELGRAAGEMLLKQIQGGAGGQVRYLPHQLIERDSTAAAAGGSYRGHAENFEGGSTK